MKRSPVSPIFLGLVVVAIGGALLCTLDSSTAQIAGTVLFVLGGWGVTLCLHEFGHAITAYKGGDYSVRAKGYLNLDPRRYTDPVFSIVLPVLFLIIGGIPLPGGAVWINHYAIRSKKMDSLASLAGPLSNLVVGILLAVAAGLIWPGENSFLSLDLVTVPVHAPAFAGAFAYLAYLQFFAFIINILPIPGLDGWGAIEPWLSPEAKRLGAQVRPWAPLALFVLLFAIPAFAHLVSTGSQDLFHVFGGNRYFINIGNNNFLFWRR
ncbi:MAG TPA: site-2 protease family protein [Pseudonocardiaceae bacterium]|nr:site-2 protease family protein [Pseudonocardiaceae bacterium]